MNYWQANCREPPSSFVKALSGSRSEERNSRNTLHPSKIRNGLNNGSVPALRATRFKQMPSQRHWEDKLHKRPSGSCTPASHKHVTHLPEQDPSSTAKTAGPFWVRFRKICDKRKRCGSWHYSCVLTLRYSPCFLGQSILHCPFPWATTSIFIVFPDYSGSVCSHTSLQQGEGTEGLPKRKGLHCTLVFWCGENDCSMKVHHAQDSQQWSNSQLWFLIAI